MRTRWTSLALSGLLIVLVAPAWADDDGAPAYEARTLDLAPYRVSDAPRGPLLATPADAVGWAEDAEAWDWFLSRDQPGGWIEFEGADTDGHALSPDVLRDLLYQLHEEPLETLDYQSLEARGSGIFVAGSPTLVRQVAESFEWATAGLAPVLRVHATLATTRPETRLLAEGAGRVFPARWTRLTGRRDTSPFVTDWNIEIAQEGTSMNPVEAFLPSGQEVYVRYHPGETVTLVEVWVGAVEHLETRKLDLSVIRNIPEGNAPGPVDFPVSRIQRAHTVLYLPAGQPAERALRFMHEGREVELTLAFSAPPGSHPVTGSGPQKMAVLKTSASVGLLDFGVREGSHEEWVQSVMSCPWAETAANEDLLQIGVVPNAGVVVGAPEVVARTRGLLVEAERALTPNTVSVELVTVAETAYRAAMAAGHIGVGRAVASDTLAALRPTGAQTTAGVTMPGTIGLHGGFRVGTSEPGLVRLEAEVAQQSAGLSPETSARFAGLSGTVEVQRRGRGFALVFAGRVSWADPEAGHVDVVQRPPVSMSMQHEDYRPEPDVRRSSRLPLLGGGEADLAADIDMAALDGTTYLLGAVVSGGEVQVVLGSVR